MKNTSILLLLCMLFHLQAKGQDEFVIRKGSDSYYTRGQLKSCYLKEKAVVEGYTCDKWIHYYDDGSLRRFTITEPVTVDGRELPEKSTVFLTKDGKLEKCFLGKKTVVDSIPCMGGLKSVTISFFPDGKIYCCFLSEMHTIQGIPCKSGIIDPIFFYPSGKLKRCTIGKKTEIQNMFLKKGTILDVDEAGRITSTSAPK